MAQLFPPTLQEEIACIERELKLRYRVYPDRVQQRAMTRQRAEREIETMQAVHRRLVKLAEGEP